MFHYDHKQATIIRHHSVVAHAQKGVSATRVNTTSDGVMVKHTHKCRSTLHLIVQNHGRRNHVVVAMRKCIWQRHTGCYACPKAIFIFVRGVYLPCHQAIFLGCSKCFGRRRCGANLLEEREIEMACCISCCCSWTRYICLQWMVCVFSFFPCRSCSHHMPDLYWASCRLLLALLAVSLSCVVETHTVCITYQKCIHITSIITWLALNCNLSTLNAGFCRLRLAWGKWAVEFITTKRSDDTNNYIQNTCKRNRSSHTLLLAKHPSLEKI